MRHTFGRSHRPPIKPLFGLTATLWLFLSPLALAESVPTPPDQGAPSGRQRGGASRSDCVNYQGLTALVPVVDNIVWSQTNSPTPDFFFYLPKALTADIPMELVVQDNQDNYVFRRQFSVDAPSGILTVPTVSTGSGLTSGEAYFWTFSIYCDSARPSASVSVSGTIKRVSNSVVIEPDLIEPDRPLTPDLQLELARQYAAGGLWHEAVDLTLSLHQAEADSQKYLETLRALLESAGLDDISPTVPVNEVPE